jgi:hypothetical protein
VAKGRGQLPVVLVFFHLESTAVVTSVLATRIASALQSYEIEVGALFLRKLASNVQDLQHIVVQSLIEPVDDDKITKLER